MKFMVFDVESIGLHGEGFAVGYVVVDADGERLDEALIACPPNAAVGDEAGREWVHANVPPLNTGVVYTSPKIVRSIFWHEWKGWHEHGAQLVADCAWPVESRFLAQCVDDDPGVRYWGGPYPLHDLASIILAAGGDPLATNPRKRDEMPAHNPLYDARQSARLLIETLRTILPGKTIAGDSKAAGVTVPAATSGDVSK